jgi:uncharacterized membrane protein
MAENGFSIGEAVHFGWKTMKANFLFFLGLLIVTGLIQFAPQFISDNLLKGKFPFNLIATLLGIAIQLVTSMGLIRITLKFCDGEKGDFGDLFSCFPKLIPFFLSSLLYFLIIIGGALLLIIPAFIWGVTFGLYPYFIIDKGMGPVAALKASAAATKGVRWDLFGLGAVNGCIVVLGVLCLLVGLFAAIPTTLVAGAWVYRRLSAQTEPVSSS